MSESTRTGGRPEALLLQGPFGRALEADEQVGAPVSAGVEPHVQNPAGPQWPAGTSDTQLRRERDPQDPESVFGFIAA